MTGKLAGLTILVTRPEQQAQHLCQLLDDEGATPLAFPLIDIQAIDNPAPVARDHYDIVIFVSNNAVTHGVPLLAKQLATASIATVGKGTAKRLEQQGHPASILPASKFDSEGLLEHPQLQNVKGKAVLIVRGEGGRPLLGDELEKRGAQVEYLAAYQRKLPGVNADNVLHDALVNNKLDIILISSVEALDNLLTLSSDQPLLLDTQLAVTHPRQAEKAGALGFKKPAIISKEPGDNALLEALIEHVKGQNKLQ